MLTPGAQNGFVAVRFDRHLCGGREQRQESVGIIGTERTAEAQAGQPSIGDHELLAIVTIELRDDLGERRRIEGECALLPRQRRLDFLRGQAFNGGGCDQ